MITYVVAYQTAYGIKYFKVPCEITYHNSEELILKNTKAVRFFRMINAINHPEHLVERAH